MGTLIYNVVEWSGLSVGYQCATPTSGAQQKHLLEA